MIRQARQKFGKTVVDKKCKGPVREEIGRRRDWRMSDKVLLVNVMRIMAYSGRYRRARKLKRNAKV